MREVVNIASVRPPSLVDELQAALAASGSVSAEVKALTVSVPEWRKAARAAGKALRRPVQTLDGGAFVHAVLKDWPANDEEAAKTLAAQRAAVAAMRDFASTLRLV